MRKWQEVKEDYPFMASRCEHAQSKFTCIAKKKVCNVNVLVSLYLLYLLFQENKSFGTITICIHPLMYKKPCREQVYTAKIDIKGTVSPDYKCLEVISINTLGKDMLLWIYKKF
jgi:hypothetical protein